MIRRLLFAASIVLLGTSQVQAAATAVAAPGWFGFSVKVASLGRHETRIVVSVQVEEVAADSPAAAQGIAAGDAIVTVEDRKVSGMRPDALGDAMRRPVGAPLHLTVRRGNAEARTVTLTAVAKPK